MPWARRHPPLPPYNGDRDHKREGKAQPRRQPLSALARPRLPQFVGRSAPSLSVRAPPPPGTTAPSHMSVAAEPGHRAAQQHQFAGVDLRRPKGYYAAAAAPVAETTKVQVLGEGGGSGEGGHPCPRCASRDTKFCYYNNYNTSQPRHFCKGCRRYWTKGGTLRNVPVGGGTRKKPSSSSSSYAAAADNNKSSNLKKKKKKAASKKRRVVAPAPEAPVAATAAADSARTTTTTTDGASEITSETEAAAVHAAMLAPAVEEEDSDSVAHLLLQPGAEDAVTLGLGLSDFPCAGKEEALVLDDDDSFVWPPAYDLGTCWGSAAGFVDPDPAGLFLNLP